MGALQRFREERRRAEGIENQLTMANACIDFMFGCSVVFSERGSAQKIAEAFARLAAPPRMFRGWLVKKNVWRLCCFATSLWIGI